MNEARLFEKLVKASNQILHRGIMNQRKQKCRLILQKIKLFNYSLYK